MHENVNKKQNVQSRYIVMPWVHYMYLDKYGDVRCGDHSTAGVSL